MKLTQLYDRLTAEERFQAFAAALARGDELELDRLENSCPQFNYRGQDDRYLRMKIRLRIISMEWLTDLYQVAEAGWVAAHLLTASPPGDEEKHEAVLLGAVRKYRALRASWSAFCGEIGVPEEATLTHLKPDLAFRHMADHLAECFPEACAPSDEEIEAYLQMCRSLWKGE